MLGRVLATGVVVFWVTMMAALVRLATKRKSLFGRRGLPAAKRLEVVSALASAGTTSARHALQRIAAEGDGTVREAAARAMD